MKLFVTIEDAKLCGLTHEGSLFGVAAWMRIEGASCQAVPKFQPFMAWTWLCDRIYDLAAWVIPAGYYLPSPIYLGASIEQLERARGMK